MRNAAKSLEELVVAETVDDLPFDTDIKHVLVDYRALTKEEKAVAFALRRQMRKLSYIVARAQDPDSFKTYPWPTVQERTLGFFDGEGADAFTDGATNIWINRKLMVKKARQGMPGFVELIGLLVHEYIHAEGSQSSHAHPLEFYEAFHNIMLDSGVSNLALAAYAGALKHGAAITSLKLSQLEKAGVDIDEPMGVGTCLEVEDEYLPVAAPAKADAGKSGKTKAAGGKAAVKPKDQPKPEAKATRKPRVRKAVAA